MEVRSIEAKLERMPIPSAQDQGLQAVVTWREQTDLLADQSVGFYLL